MGEGLKQVKKKIEEDHRLDINNVAEYQDIRNCIKDPKLLDFLDNYLSKIINKFINNEILE